MNWPDIAGCLRKHMAQVTSERVGQIAGVWRDKASGREVDGFQVTSERGGTKLVLQVEIGDLEQLHGSVAAALKQGVPELVLLGRFAALKKMIDVTPLTPVKLEEAAVALVARAMKVRQNGASALT